MTESRPRRLVVLPGDGVGPEVTAQAVRVLDWLRAHRALDVDYGTHPFGVAHFEAHGRMVDPATLEAVEAADAVLFGAIGGVGYDAVPIAVRRQQGLLGLRRRLGLFANLRPVRAYRALEDASSLKPEVVRGVDLVVVRELAGGIYFGEPRGTESAGGDERRGFNTMSYVTSEVRRVARVAFELARTRRRRVCSVDKANVLETSELWRATVEGVGAAEFPDVELSHLYVDNAAIQIVRDPRRFDVIVTGNLFGDILSDCAGAIAASLGMLPSASLSDPDADGRRHALYEPVHGSAPDIAGRGVANPIGAILSLALALRLTCERPDAADLVEAAVEHALAAGARTADVAAAGARAASTVECGDAVIAGLETIDAGGAAAAHGD